MGEQQRPVADDVHLAIERLVAQAANNGEVIWTGGAVHQLRAEFPQSRMSPAEVVEALVRAAATRGLAVAFRRFDGVADDGALGASPSR